MAPANNKTALKAEIERKLEKENLERRLRLERERKPAEVPGVKIPQFLSRNALAKGLTNLKVPDLLPLRDAILSLSDPGFLNKKFNQDVYRELPQRVKDFIALPANQVTRAVIISKIIEAVKLAKKNANNANFNRGVAKALVNLAPKPNNKKPRVATTNTGTSAKPVNAATGTNVKPVTTTNAGTSAKPANTGVNVATQANNLTNKIANLQARLNKAQENAAVAAAEQKAEANAKVAELTKSLNETTNALEKQRTEAEKMVANLRAERNALSGATNTEKANLAKKLANAEVALKTLRNNQNRRIKELMNEKIALGQNMNQLTSEMKSKINNLTRQLSEAPAANQITNLESKLGQLTANKEAALAEVNQYKKDFAIATKTLENLTTKGVANKQQISTLERSIRILETRLKNLGNRRVAETKGLREMIKELRSELQKLSTAPAPVQNTGNAPSALNLFKTKVTEAKKTIANARLDQLLVNANKPNPNLANLERQFADIAGKPRIYLFLNQFDGTNFPNYAKPTGIQTFGAKSDNVTNAVTNIKSIVSDYTSIEPKKNLNLFFIGPSGSGKTFLFNKYLGKNISGMVTAYYPTFDYNLQSGILTISDESEQMSYGKFKQRFIRPTPFNPNSSRAHMSYQNGDVTAFDLAGTENPMAIMDKALGYNIFEKQYWEKFSSASVSDIAQRRQTQTEVKQLLAALELPSNGVGLSGLDQMVFLYVFWNYIDRKVGPIERVIRRFRQKKINPSRLQLLVEIFNDIKRVFEGFWITRSLHALNLLFTNNSYKNLVNKTNTTVTGSNIARSNVTGSKGAFEIELKRRVVNKRGIPKYETSNFVKQLANIPLSQSAKFIILNKTNPSYETNFVADLKQSGNRNCLIGVVNAQSQFPEQRQAAINYLESLQK
jgi:hypothetical protein